MKRRDDPNAPAISTAWPLTASLAVLLLSPLSTLLTQSDVASLLVVLAVLIVFWSLTRLSRRRMGFRLGNAAAALTALLYPVVVIVPLAALAWLGGGAPTTGVPWGEVGKWLGLMFVNTFIGVLITEEGFFRGWLWGSLEAAGASELRTLAWTSLVFTGWHVGPAILEPSFRLPAGVAPVYLANVLLLGTSWGLLRLVSGSIFAPVIAHASWNAFAYVMFGYGTKTGKLGVGAYEVFGPERGYLGVVANLIVVAMLGQWWVRRRRASGSPTPPA